MPDRLDFIKGLPGREVGSPTRPVGQHLRDLFGHMAVEADGLARGGWVRARASDRSKFKSSILDPKS